MKTGSASALHESVRQEITRRATSGEYETGAPLPSAAALAEEFGVSAITVKRALRDLQSAGILRSVPGLGTFVREQRRFIRDLDLSLTSMEDAKRLGFTPTLQLISTTRERIQDKSFDIFTLPDGPLLCVRKIIFADDVPIMLDTSYLPISIGDDVVDEFGRKFIYDALRERGVRITATRLMIDAAPASAEVQQVFEVPNGYPTLRRVYRFTTDDQSIFVFGVVESPFDRLACTIELPEATGRGRRRRSGPVTSPTSRKSPASRA